MAVLTIVALRRARDSGGIPPQTPELAGSTGRERALRETAESQGLFPLDSAPGSAAPEANGSPAEARSAAARTAAEEEQVDCELLLRVVGRLDKKPVESEVEVWRLDTEAGLFATVSVPAEGLLLGDVARGRYRAHVRARKRTAVDPPAFRVEPPRTEIVLEVETSRTYELLLEVRDERGAQVRLGRFSSGYRRVPAFAPDFGATSGGATPDVDLGGFDFGSRHLSVEHDDGRFRLGHVRDLDCDQGGGPLFELRPKGRFPVSVDLPGHERFFREHYGRADDVLVVLGVALPEGWFDGAIFLPDGRAAREAGARIEARCRALAVSESELEAGDAWKRVPTSVSVELERFEPLRFEYTLGQGAPERRELRPSGQ